MNNRLFNRQALLFGVSICCISCVETPSQRTETSAPEASPSAEQHYVLPSPPADLTDPYDQANYLAEHYWDNYNFTDTTLLSKPDFCEQTFVDFLPVLSSAPSEKSEQGIHQMLTKAIEGNSQVFWYFIDLFEQYLYHPNSPVRNEELYIPVLRWVVASDKVDEAEKIRPRDQLEIVLKNRVGAVAEDFTYTLGSGARHQMSSIKADYTILFFNNPDCDECRRAKEYMVTSPAIKHIRSQLAILAVYPDPNLELWREATYPDELINSYDAGLAITHKRLYDLKAIPTLYLLDKYKRVILKDVQIEQIDAWFRSQIVQ